MALSYESVPDLSPVDTARERRIALFKERMEAAPSARVAEIWRRAMTAEIQRRSAMARSEAERAGLGEDGW